MTLRTVLALAAAAAVLVPAAPADATCMEHVDKAGVRVFSCAPPSGPATVYVCVGDTCTP
jgi:hypothetical protein